MTDPARNRWFALSAIRIAAALGAVLGVVLIGRAEGWGERGLGLAIVLSALWMGATIPLALAHRWRSGE